MSRGRLWTEEQFNCPVCLDLPTEPVTIPCGHSYCMECIADYWDSEHRKSGECSCPECRQTFDPRPTLCRNTMLAEAVEQLRLGNLSSTARESIRSAHRAAASASERVARDRQTALKQLPASLVPCERCQEPRAAVKTCLMCMASFCESHLKPHNTQAKLKAHELIAPTGDLTQKMCPEHKYLHEFYCRPCQVFVCWLCTSNQHKGHECVSTQMERSEKQKTLTTMQTENHQRLQERERELKDMKKVVETLKCSSDSVSEETDVVLGELQRSVQRLADLIQQVMGSSGQEKISDAEQAVDKLESEIRELKKKDGELKELVGCQDNIYFLKTYQCLSSPVLGEIGSVSVNPEASFDSVQSIVLDLREKVENLCNQELDKINKTVFNTTPFTVMDQQSQNPQKPAILKLFSGLGAKTGNSRTQGPPPLPSVSVRGPGPATQNTRSRNGPQVERGTNSLRTRANQNREEREQAETWSVSSLSPRERQRRNERDSADTWSLSSLNPRERQRRNEREPEREAQNSPGTQNQSRRSRNMEDEQADTRSVRSLRPQSASTTVNDEQADTWSLSSIRSRNRQRNEEQDQADTWSLSSNRSRNRQRNKEQDQADTWSLSSMRSRSERETVNGEVHRPQQTSPATRQQPERQSDRWSLSSLLPRNRKKKQESVRQATPIQQEVEPSSPQNQWGNLTEDFSNSPAFPTLREIDINSIQAPEPRNRDEFLRYACELTFDLNTAHRRLVLSEDDTKVTLQASAQSYPDTPERFDGWTQILCLQPLGGTRCYWEVEWRGRGSSVGVASASMLRKGSDSRAGLGYNGQSWSLELSDMCCAALHANQKQEIAVTYSPRVGVFLDREAESLAFYSVDDVLVHLHTFQGVSVRQPLFAAFGVGSGVGVGLDFAMGNFSAATDSIKLCTI